MKKLIIVLSSVITLSSCTKVPIDWFGGKGEDTIIIKHPVTDTVKTVRLNTEKEITSKEVYVKGTLGVDTIVYVTEARGRGNTTWSYPWIPKLPYKIKFADKQKPFGWESHKEFALLANYFDNTHGLRNDVFFHLSDVMQRGFTPKTKHVDLQLNGQYNGLYLFAETIDKDRAKVENKNGGWLIEISHNGADEYFEWGIVNPVDDPFNYGMGGKVPSDFKEGSSLSDTKEQLDTLWAVAYRKDWEKLHEIFDVQSFATFFLVTEISKNNDGMFHSSVYLQKDNKTGKIKMGPMWDGDLSAGNPFIATDAQPTGWRLNQAQLGNMLVQDPLFKSLVKQEWEKHKVELKAIPLYITAEAKHIQKSAEANNKKWQIQESFNANVEALKSWYITRLNWIEQEIVKL